MPQTIFLCASMSFYKELVTIEEQLQAKGFQVQIPVSAKIMKEKQDFDATHFKNVFTAKEKQTFIRENFENIGRSDAILVINNEKNGVSGYIGANVLMEVGLAFYLKKKIYIWNPVSDTASYKEELNAFDVIYINQNIENIV